MLTPPADLSPRSNLRWPSALAEDLLRGLPSLYCILHGDINIVHGRGPLSFLTAGQCHGRRRLLDTAEQQ